MSAFVCSDHHIRVLAVAIVLSGVKWRRRKSTPPATRCAEYDHVAHLLAKENARSVNHRYAHHKNATKHFFGGKDAPIGDDNITPKGAEWCVDKVRDHHSRQMIGVTLQRTGGPVKRYDALTIYKALQCYDYQSCEHPSWTKSEAFRMYEAASAFFAREAIYSGMREAYDRAPWTLDE
jgi:hypothetical protein